MIYLDFHRYMSKYKMAQKAVDKILDEKEILFQKTQPKSTLKDHEREFDKKINVSSSGHNNDTSVSERYVIELEQKQIQERLDNAKAIMQERLIMVNQVEPELRASKDPFDIIYVMKYLDSMSVREIAESTYYSESHVYWALRRISHKIKDMAENDRK